MASFLCKLTAIVAGVMLLAAGLVAVGLASAAPPVTPPDKPAAAPAQRVPIPARRLAPVPKPQPPGEGIIVVTSFNKNKPVELVKPDGTSIREPAVGEATAPWVPRLSPDGKRLAVIKLAIKQEDTGPWTHNQLFILDLDAKEGPQEPVLNNLRMPHIVWSRDGTKLYGSQIDPDKENDPIDDSKPNAFVSWVYDPATKAKTPLAVPSGHAIIDVSPDGKTLLTVTFNGREVWISSSTHLVPLDTLKPRPLTEKAFTGMRFSPDGKSVLGTRNVAKTDPPHRPLIIVSVADASERDVKLPDGVPWLYHACWSPDGKRVAYHWKEEVPQPPGVLVPAGQGPVKWYASRVTVADADGGNPKTIIRREEDQSITGIDWR